jgi:hypothetical protein
MYCVADWLRCGLVALRTGCVADWLRTGVGLSENPGCQLVPAKHAADMGVTTARVVKCTARCVMQLAQTFGYYLRSYAYAVMPTH